MLGPLISSYYATAVPVWVNWAMHLPCLRRRMAKRAVSELHVHQQGIRLVTPGRPQLSLTYTQVRRIWFELYHSADDQPGHTSFRIDIISEALDTLFTLRLTDCEPSHPTFQLMQQLYQLWQQANWHHYSVVAAVITLTAATAGRSDLPVDTPVYLCMQRSRTRYDYTSYHWEFPGGKVEPGEEEPVALRRELREEMDYEVTVGRHITTVEHRYRDFSISLSCYLCTATTAQFTRREHHDHRWLTPAEMQSLEWCAADAPVLSLLAADEPVVS